jgi:hypothetical protein
MENLMAINFSDLGGVGGGKYQKTEIITSTQSWTVPADVDSLEILICGGGGSGSAWTNGGNGGGGGSAEFAWLSVIPGSTHVVTIGAGGPGPGGQSYGSQGAPSSFGSLFTVSGGFNGASDFGGKAGGLAGTNGGSRSTTTAQFLSEIPTGPMGYGTGGPSATHFTQRWTNAPANSGGGGRGASGQGGGFSGGSGICIIKYWTAG